MESNTDIDRVVSLLSTTHPTTEAQLLEWLRGEGLDTDRAKRATNEAHARNLIRWVAFRGWLKGGRP